MTFVRSILRNVYKWLLLIGLSFSYALMTFAWMFASSAESREIRKAEIYMSYFRAADNDQLARDMENAEAYNEDIFEEQMRHEKQNRRRFSYGGEKATDAVYESQLCRTEAMAYLEIPSLSLMLPIVHGMDSDALQSAVGHFYKTSLPVGGPSTHCVLAAHSALPDNRLFTDLPELKCGDEFKIHVLDKTLVYEVRDIRVVWPEDADEYLGIEPYEDRVTLYTCTPYAVNTHRLLVQGGRLKAAACYPAEEETTATASVQMAIPGIEEEVQRQGFGNPLRIGEQGLFSLVTVVAAYGLSRVMFGKEKKHGL